jgi:hypothetical protein
MIIGKTLGNQFAENCSFDRSEPDANFHADVNLLCPLVDD